MAKREIDYFEGLTTDALARATYVNDGSLVTETFNANDTWTCPVGIFEIIVECWGKGGAGGNAWYYYDGEYGQEFKSGAGGGGGAYSKKTIAVTPGNTYNVYVGTDVYFVNTSTVLAKGGTDAVNHTPGTGGLASAGVGDVKYSGGNGKAGQNSSSKPSSSYYGGGGGAATSSTNGDTATSPTGASYGGGDGNGTGAGEAGTAPGGAGGGGGFTGFTYNWVAYNGGAGGAGKLTISYYPLYAHKESSVINEGSYSLKFGAVITNSLNEVLTKIISPAKDFAGINTLHFDIRATRTGSNIKIGLHDSGGNTTEITPNITDANTWQTVNWDISGVSNANKNAIDRVYITVVNAGAGNVVYLDNFYGDFTAPITSLADLNIELRDKDGVLKTYLTPFVTSIDWSWNRFGGCGDCSITLSKPYSSITFAAMDDIQIRMRDGVTSKLVYRGYIESFEPTDKIDQEIRLDIRGYFESLKKLVVQDSGDVKTYTTQEISLIVKNIIDTFVTPNSFVTSSIYDIEAGSFTVDSIKFLTTVADALETLSNLAGDVEYGVDETLAFYWKTESTTVTHKFFIGNNVKVLERRTDFSELVNKIYLVGGENAGVKYKRTAQDTGSQTDYFMSEEIINNGSITTEDVADQYLTAILAQKSEPIVNITAEVINTPIRIEDTIPLGKAKFSDPYAGTTDDTAQINRISYSLSNTVGRFNIKIETGNTKLKAAAKIKRLELAMASAQQN